MQLTFEEEKRISFSVNWIVQHTYKKSETIFLQCIFTSIQWSIHPTNNPSIYHPFIRPSFHLSNNPSMHPTTSYSLLGSAWSIPAFNVLIAFFLHFCLLQVKYMFTGIPSLTWPLRNIALLFHKRLLSCFHSVLGVIFHLPHGAPSTKFWSIWQNLSREC